MSNEKNNPSMYDHANRFIDLANELTQEDPSGNVGTAIRYAASRYNTFEASQMSDDLSHDKEAVIERYVADFRKMMEVNIEQYIEHLKQH